MEETPSAAIVAIHQHDDHINPGLTSFLSPFKTLPYLHRALLPDMSSRNPPRVPDHLPCIEDLIAPDDDDDDDDEEEEEEEEEGSRFEIWHSIQEDKMTMMKKKKMEDRDQWPGEFDIWSSIMSQNRSQWSESETTLPTPYVHPLVRRSSSCLSDKSLEICTESLGSESGSDYFSSFPLPGMGRDYEKDGKNDGFFPAAFCRADVEKDFGDKPSFHARPRNKERPQSFPPPLPSLSSAADGTSIQMRSRRENGRLILQAVSVPYQKNFHALRENGRLVLVFTAPDVDHCDYDYISKAEREVTDEIECGDGEGIEWIIGEKVESRVEIVASSPNIDYIGKLEIPIAMLMNKPDKVREVVFFKGIDGGGELKIDPLPNKANTLNVYEYFWRTITSATTTSAITDPSETTRPPPPNTKNEHLISCNDIDLRWSDQREVQVLLNDYTKSMEDCWVSVMKDCRRRSLFFPGATLHCHVMT